MIDLKDKNRPPSTEVEVPNEDSATRSAGQLPEQAGEREAPSIGVDSTARTGADLSLDPLGITTLEQAKASLTAMDTLNSISNKPWLKTMALIDSINNPPWKKAMAMIEAIENPPWKQAMAAMQAIENPSWRNALAAADSINNPSWKKAMAAIESIENPRWKQALTAANSLNNPAWKKAMEVIESAENPRWKQSLAAADSINNPSWIKAMAAIESAQPPRWKQAMDVALQSINNPGLQTARAALESLKVSSWRNAFTELNSITSSSALRMAAVAIGSWGDLDSPLLGYLASDEAHDISAILAEVALQNPESLFSSDTAEHEDVPAMERQIFEKIDSGDAVGQLPAPARAHLLQYMMYLYHFMNVIMYLMNVWQAVAFAQGELSDAKSPAEVKACIAQIPQDQASLLSGHRVLIGDKVKLRTQPSEKSEIKALPKIGAILEVLEDGEVWIRVSVDVSGEILEGWIARRYTVAIDIPKKQ
ncbi:hypothetical protein D3C76_257990 [compost metagenome]